MTYKKILALVLVSALAINLSACGVSAPAYAPEPQKSNNDSSSLRGINGLTEFVRDPDTVSFEGIPFNKWDTAAAGINLEKQSEKPYTIMIYLNGSDLESENGSASADIDEMLESGVSDKNVNLLLFTGGTASWQNDLISSDTCAIWQISDGDIIQLADVGNRSIGDAGTLASFIDFGMTYFPAKKYALSFWNHGGGFTGGFGYDENFPDNDNLSLLELNMAFENSKAKETALEWISFDACLMANIETAVIAQPYAKYMIASEDLEPDSGWDYNWLAALNENPAMSGEEIGRHIVDTFVDYYENEDDATGSVIDLASIGCVVSALDALMIKAGDGISEGAFKKIAKARENTRTFGDGSQRNNEYDMVDLGHMANTLAYLYPDEAADLCTALQNCILYSRASSYMDNITGLTAYYLYGGKDYAAESVEAYNQLQMGLGYTAFLGKFATALTDGDITEMVSQSQMFEINANGNYSATLSREELENLIKIEYLLWEPIEGEEDYYYLIGQHSNVEIDENGKILTEFDGDWPGINGEFVCMYELEKYSDRTVYAIPAELNGKDVDIIAIFGEKYPDGKILGARVVYDNSGVAAKGLMPIKNGDKVAFVYQAEYFGESEKHEDVEWYIGDTIIVNDSFRLEWFTVNPDEIYVYNYLLTDVRLNQYYTEFIEVIFE